MRNQCVVCGGAGLHWTDVSDCLCRACYQQMKFEDDFDADELGLDPEEDYE